ncbi:MAG TPA: hypothetical protein VIY09_00635 [Rhizomicrobium sp.]
MLQTALFIVAWLVGLEVLTRSFLLSPTNIVPDPLVGYLYAPDSTALIETADAGFRRASFNELGLNDWPVAPNDRRPRILVLGDSYVEAFQVPRSRNFLGVLGRDRRDLRFVNGGRSGLDPVSEYLMLEKLAPAVHPAGVILVVNSGDANDLLADGLTISRCWNGRDICGYAMPPIAQPYRHGAEGAMGRSSALLTYLVRRFEAPARAELPRIARWLPAFAAAKASARSADSYSAEDFEPLLVCIFRRIALRYRLIVVAVPDMEFAPGGRSAVNDKGAFAERVGRAAATAGATFFDAAPVLAADYARTGQPPRGFEFNRPGSGHLNAAGHAAVAHGIERHLGIFEQRIAG